MPTTPLVPAAPGPLAAPPRPGRQWQAFRRWPAWVLFAPVAAWVLVRGAVHRDLSLPAIANPLAGRDTLSVSASKSAVFAALGAEARAWVPPYIVMRNSGPAAATASAAMAMAREAGLDFPLVAKPDRGTGGKGVRLLTGKAALRAYAAAFPPGGTFLLQELADLPHEAGIMYVRHPGAARGTVTALARKEPAVATGDGRSTLRALIETHPLAPLLRRQALAEHAERLDRVPAPGQTVELVFARNRSGGAVCLDAAELITPALSARIDGIARTVPGFHVGRFDVRFESPERLREGQGFRIVEINCGISEPLHAWDPSSGLLDVWRAYFRQIDLIYRIGAENRALGHATPGTPGFLRTLWSQRRQMSAFGAKR